MGVLHDSKKLPFSGNLFNETFAVLVYYKNMEVPAGFEPVGVSQTQGRR